jgi:hypothetical protein
MNFYPTVKEKITDFSKLSLNTNRKLKILRCHGYPSLVSVVCCQAEVFETGCSLI